MTEARCVDKALFRLAGRKVWRRSLPIRQLGSFLIPVSLRALCLAYLLMHFSGAPPTYGQSSRDNDVVFRMGAPAGARRYRPGTWTVVEVNVINKTGQDAEVESTLRFLDEPTLQYSRRVTVPPRSNLRTTCPLLVPELPPSQTSARFVTERAGIREGENVNNRLPNEAILAPQSLLLEHEVPSVGMLADMEQVPPHGAYIQQDTGIPADPPVPDQSYYDLVLAAKRSQGLSRSTTILDSEDLPPYLTSLDALDVLFVCSDQIAEDPVGISVVQDWVLGGGNLWIALDAVQADTVSVLMGDAFATTVVDRTRLTSAAIENIRPSATEDEEPTKLDFEIPVELLRVVPHGVTVTDMVNGWPAAFWQPFGHGRVFFTTLGPAAWMRPTTSQDPPPRDGEDATPFFPRKPLGVLAAECLTARRAHDQQPLEPFLSKQIGYWILKREAVLGILAAYCLMLLGSCFWFLRTSRAEHILWIAPLAAAATGAVFLGIATNTKRSVPPTVGTIATAVLEPGLGTAHLSGLAAIYNQDVSRESLGATQGGILVPDMRALSGQRRRINWSDESVWQWNELELPPGVRTAPFEHAIHLERSPACRVRFGRRGLQGSLSASPFTGFEDAIIVVPHQNVTAAKIGGNGAFESTSDDVLEPGSYMAGTFMGDRRMLRTLVYDQVLARDSERDLPERPMLYAWADAADIGFTFPQPNRFGSILLSIPLQLEKCPRGIDVVVPPPFVPYRLAPAPNRQNAVAGSIVGRWLETELTATYWIRFQLPSSVLPIEPTRATLTTDVRAPSRTIEILAISEGNPVTVKTLVHPIGTYSAEVNRPGLLKLDEEGGLLLAVRVSRDEWLSQTPWRIDSLQLEVAGTVLDEPNHKN